ncbi:Uma2 family endonuclease [Cronbergia sp. UHCC 0137]|uniref:Uma2 family endonuclease n=1 Tax=Cronbergia sp. UHCC 0137 TaxID=3110239 RepID=UPI002B21DB99|nr:Uma2 family endonuclease [Cronbergia sp. UHCC 0137]MEA5619873.1 Uma2 family endonuclease [Cronbergia sp. UHCC 0137]
MTTSLKYIVPDIDYPESDGLPMAESDAARDYLVYGVETLTIHFQTEPEVYTSGNLFIYYEQGNPKAVVAPDLFVVFGVEKKKRTSYKVWEENYKVPDFVLEITSKSTVSEYQGTKKGLYAYLGVKEYFQYDPTADYLKPPLQGFRLVEGNYLPIPRIETENGFAVMSEVLGLELRLENGEMRFYNPKKGEKLLTHQELELARQEAEQELLAEQEKNKKLANRLRELGIDPNTI